MLLNEVDRMEDFGAAGGATQRNDPNFFNFVHRTFAVVKEFFSGGNLPVLVESDYEVEAEDGLLLIDATAGNIALTLIDPASAPGREIVLKRVDGSVNTVTVTPAAGTIDGAANITLNTQYKVRRLYPGSATAWYITGAHL